MGCCLDSSPRPVSRTGRDQTHLGGVQDPLGPLIRSERFIHEYQGKLERSYRLERQLGAGEGYLGAYGRVYEAVHLATGAKRAVKVLERDRLAPSQVDQMLSEVTVLKTLVSTTQDHPYILKIFEVIVEADKINIVSELCTGGELFNKIIKLKRFTEKMASTYMQQILSAVAYCHERQIVHRDLKPENLLLETSASDALLKVIDFGTSSKVDPNSTLSSPFYIAPEVLSKQYNEKCDVWSCGVILYILLSGSPPFTGHKDKDILEKVKAGHYEFTRPEWRNVSNKAKDMIRLMMTVDPQKRPSARELLQNPWFKQSDKISVGDKVEELDIMTQMKDFRATLQYIASQLTTVEQTESLRRKFIQMDENGDGKLSREEIGKGFKVLGLSATVNLDKIMQDCDSDHSGFIDYSEFVTAAMNWQKSLNDQQIEAAFAAFDEDHSGKIDMDELKKVFGISIDDDTDDTVWRKIMEEVDEDGDGLIDLEEFKHMMLQKYAVGSEESAS